MKNSVFCLSLLATSVLCSYPLAAAADEPEQSENTTSAPAAAAPADSPAAPDEPANPAATQINLAKGSYGTVVSAEISFVKPDFADENEYDATPYGENTAWVQLILRPQVYSLPSDVNDPNSEMKEYIRSVSRFDCQLKFNNSVYPCLAIAKNDVPFSMQESAWKITPESGSFVRMLFALPQKNESGTDNFNGTPILTLERAIAKNKLGGNQICFRLMPSGQTFTSVEDIRKLPEGSCGISYDDLMKRLNPNGAAPAAPAAAPTASATPAAPASPAATPAPAAPATPTPAPAPAPTPAPAPAPTPAPAPAPAPTPAPAPAPAPAQPVKTFNFTL